MGAVPSPQGLCVHEVRDIDLAIAVLAGMEVQHELGERTVQVGEPPREHDEARRGDASRGLEVHHPECLAEVHVVLGLERQIGRRAETPDLDIVGLARPRRDGCVGDIGDQKTLGLDLLEDRGQIGLGACQPIALVRDLGQQGGNVLAARLDLADGLGAGVTAAL